MKIRHLVATAVAGIAAGVIPLAAQADTVLYEGIATIGGQQSTSQSLNIPTPGTLTVSLTSIPWFATLSDLGFFLSTATNVVAGSTMATGTESLSVSPGKIYANWFGEDAGGAYGFGTYGVNISFKPNAGSVVPLPASLLLLLSGLGILLGWQRRERSTVQDEPVGEWA